MKEMEGRKEWREGGREESSRQKEANVKLLINRG